MSRKILLALIIAILPSLPGCVGSSRQRPVKEVHYTRMRMGTPAYVVGKAGKPQVLSVQVPNAKGELVFGRLDANGMVLIDEPTLEYYRKLDSAGSVVSSSTSNTNRK